MDKPKRQTEVSRFLLLPPEVRLLVYRYLFSSTRLTHGQRPITRISATHKMMKPVPNSLAILRSCRFINREIGSSWLGQVLFAFERLHDLLEKLSSMPRPVVEQIRHIRVGSQPILLPSPPQYGDSVFVRLVWALKLLPGLCLDTLTVFGDHGPDVAYITLDDLVNCGNKWHYITGDSNMLGFRRVRSIDGVYGRMPQPSTWSRVMAERDGVDSGASVTIYRSTQTKIPGAVTNPHNRQRFEQELQLGERLESFGVDEDPELMHEDNARKELLVIVRRGQHAEIAEDTAWPCHKNDVRLASGAMTWPEIMDMYEWQPLDSEDETGFGEVKQLVEYDGYIDVDEYTIIPLD
ncbi:hypothetical protein BJX68DRAFT_266181 [Aspergillus pseudodeflectus]|uniref:F-box domain-containing protein n=1 Tax=Aspergillus pseudodeflectus TaxID=176178 RepID=A0ABR4KG68_9EURO